nr:MAG TPA: hypothetical protein [Caudoviricetes sp.]
MGYHKVQVRDNDLYGFVKELINDAMKNYIQKISEILYQYDFLLTGCQENPDMKDEYRDVSELIYSLVKRSGGKLSKDDLVYVFDSLFEYDILNDMGVCEHTIQECVTKIENLFKKDGEQ